MKKRLITFAFIFAILATYAKEPEICYQKSGKRVENYGTVCQAPPTSEPIFEDCDILMICDGKGTQDCKYASGLIACSTMPTGGDDISEFDISNMNDINERVTTEYLEATPAVINGNHTYHYYNTSMGADVYYLATWNYNSTTEVYNLRVQRLPILSLD